MEEQDTSAPMLATAAAILPFSIVSASLPGESVEQTSKRHRDGSRNVAVADTKGRFRDGVASGRAAPSEVRRSASFLCRTCKDS